MSWLRPYCRCDGLEKVSPFKTGEFLVSMFDFWGVFTLQGTTVTYTTWPEKEKSSTQKCVLVGGYVSSPGG